MARILSKKQLETLERGRAKGLEALKARKKGEPKPASREPTKIKFTSKDHADTTLQDKSSSLHVSKWLKAAEQAVQELGEEPDEQLGYLAMYLWDSCLPLVLNKVMPMHETAGTKGMFPLKLLHRIVEIMGVSLLIEEVDIHGDRSLVRTPPWGLDNTN